MKRFWTQASVGPRRTVLLDDRPVRTPGRAPLALPTDALADAVAAEWASVGEEVDPRAMRLTGLANAAIDRIGPDPVPFAEAIARYGASDLLCYRADGPDDLVAAQIAAWDPPLAWARSRYDVHFAIARGVMPVAQPPATLARLAAAVAAEDAFHLAAVSPLVTLTGSLVLGLALRERAMAGEQAWAAATLDETWQAERWGLDPEAARALAARRDEFDATLAFLNALDTAGAR